MAFEGKFKLVEQEFFDDYLRALGASQPIRAMRKSEIPVVELTGNGDGTFTWTATAGVTERTVTFTPGVAVTVATDAAYEAESTFTLEEGVKLTEEGALKERGVSYRIVWTLEGDMTLRADYSQDNVTATRYFQRQ